MHLPRWLRLESRSTSLENPATSLSDPASWLWDALGARSSSAGISVTPDNSLGVTSIWAGVRRIASDIAGLPLHVYERTSDGGKTVAHNHPVYSLLHDQVNPETSSFIWRETTLAHLLLWGNAYAEIERNGAGTPVALWPVHPSAAKVARAPNGAKLYIVRVDGSDVPLSADNILHIPGFGTDSVLGLSPVQVARDAIGLAKATEGYASAWFKSGAQPSAVLTHPAKLGKTGTDNIRDSWTATHGGLSNAQRIAVLEEGLTYTPVGLSPEQSQALESRAFSVQEASRILGCPPHIVGDLSRSTYSNVESQQIDYVQGCLLGHCRRLESAINNALLGDGYFAEFSLSGLMRGDSQARAAYLSTALQNGWISINEARAYESLNNIGPDGDVHRVQLNMAPIGAQPEDTSDE